MGLCTPGMKIVDLSQLFLIETPFGKDASLLMLFSCIDINGMLRRSTRSKQPGLQAIVAMRRLKEIIFHRWAVVLCRLPGVCLDSNADVFRDVLKHVSV